MEAIHRGSVRLFSELCQSEWILIQRNMKLEHYIMLKKTLFTTHQNLNVKAKIAGLVEENIGIQLNLYS